MLYNMDISQLYPRLSLGPRNFLQHPNLKSFRFSWYGAGVTTRSVPIVCVAAISLLSFVHSFSSFSADQNPNM
ncbi:hypothetical protein VNO80_29669 [Phaseolus coccineus]|uniref:Uncharacterized protein n=1 Tax=Phaseolus coccineus TaxID=3886 RepID=A0AAN9QIQ5_PHACN